MKENINISDSETIIMKAVWSMGSATSREVINIVTESTGWKPTTIKTLLKRLTNKKALKVVKDGNKNIYYPISSQETVYRAFFDDAVYNICNKSVGKMIKYLIESNELSSNDLSEIESAVKNKIPNDNIKCNCIEKFGVCNCIDCKH